MYLNCTERRYSGVALDKPTFWQSSCSPNVINAAGHWYHCMFIISNLAHFFHCASGTWNETGYFQLVTHGSTYSSRCFILSVDKCLPIFVSSSLYSLKIFRIIYEQIFITFSIFIWLISFLCSSQASLNSINNGNLE